MPNKDGTGPYGNSGEKRGRCSFKKGKRTKLYDDSTDNINDIKQKRRKRGNN